MSNSTAQHSNTSATGLNHDGVKGIVRELMRPFILLAVLLIAAGKIGWTNAWVFFGVFLFWTLNKS